MSEVCLIFPHQLYADHPCLRPNQDVILVEEHLYFNQYPFHKGKLIFHRASMKAYAAELKKQKRSVQYIDATDKLSEIRLLIPALHKKGIRTIRCCDPTDDWLLRRIRQAAVKHGITLDIVTTPNFICSPDEVIAGKKQPKYFQTDFYIRQRKKHGWLLEADGKPTGGQWTFDADNRKPLPKNISIPTVALLKDNPYTKEAKQYVEANFKDHYGEVHTPRFPVTRSESLEWLDVFLQQRLASFGDYEDAMQPKELFLFHSGLTPMLNAGLLSPHEIIDRTLQYAKKKNIPLASLEGFLRQVTGWREFIRLVYKQAGRTQRTTNYWSFTRKIPEAFWTGNTGIPPVDSSIKKLLETGYNHHIERLMILGNFMLLCEFDPDEVYKWFMTLYIDAYDWVMVPNVYGMTQFADGGLMTTKPYISGSNYLMKMGRWEKGEWQQVWDGLFWRFLSKQRTFFTQNPRLGMLLKTWEKMAPEKKTAHLRHAEDFLKKLDQ